VVGNEVFIFPLTRQGKLGESEKVKIGDDSNKIDINYVRSLYIKFKK
jgi:hypothetical protein